MKRIPVSGRAWTLVDDEDYEALSLFAWHFSGDGYVARSTKKGGVRRGVYMHKQVLPVEGEVDHINQNPLDNRRDNLRPATRRQNAQNQRPRGGASRFHGVGINRRDGCWSAQVRCSDGRRWQRSFKDELVAAMAAEAVRSVHQPFAAPDPGLTLAVLAHRDALRGLYV